ncbi:MAG TPA: hypothetical protein VKP69_21200 [Isosphaeraceae bacterium]|nr:hypothetical protein [Isosphaeraceae bacterium]
MAPETHATRRETQEQSIKARKDELFEGRPRGVEGGGGLRRPFRAYLYETPAAPLSLGVKASLWGAGAVVGLLFVAAIAGGHGTRATVPTDLVIPATTPRPPVVASVPSPTATPAHSRAPTPAPDKEGAEEEDTDKGAPKPVTIAAGPNQPELPYNPRPGADGIRNPERAASENRRGAELGGTTLVAPR